jgi:hypothetical protein
MCRVSASGAEECKHRFRPHASRYKIESKYMPRQRLKDRDVTSRYYEEFKSELQGVQAQPLSLDEKCKKLEETIQRVATNTIGYTRKQANKEWFDEECAKVNEEKNATKERPIQSKTRGAKNAFKLARTKERRLFRKRQGSSTKRL